MLAPDGALREPWHGFAEFVDALGPHELSRRWQQARRLIHEDGVTYNVDGDQERDRRWELDALPLLMRAGEWASVATGLIQRANLLNAILEDLYGPQHLLAEGLLPAQLVLGNPDFLRPCHGWPLPRERFLHLYAAHLARSPEGTWWVVADRTQTPVGAGYAVENRIVVSRMIPHIFQHCQVERLARFFVALRESLQAAATGVRGEPHVVLLSRGPASPTYFEDAYLARYLGYALVEGEDLTVRDNRVFLKTLGGLNPVDVVFRRVHDRDCDPLELDGASRNGVAGLVHAARRGNVALANALGSAVLEMPALLAFLPALARRLLGEDLRLPSVQTWWCGDRDALAFVLAHLDRLVVRPAIPDPAIKPILAASLTGEQRAELAVRIQAAPGRFVAQEIVDRSTAPVWSDGVLGHGHIALRSFIVASGDSYEVMPGALAHVSGTSETPSESMFVGHGSKDVWVIADGPVAPVTLLRPPGTPVAPRRSGHDLPSRVADNLFWLGRHVERAEGAARTLRSIFARMISESAFDTREEVAVLFRALTWQWPDPTGAYEVRAGQPVDESRVLAFFYDAQHPGSLPTILAALRHTASAVRNRISIDTWRILQRLDDDFQPGHPTGVVSLADVVSMLDQVILNLSAVSGLATENMTRGPGWQFLDLGRRLERALAMISLLRCALFVPANNENGVLEALLEIADSAMTYRSRYAADLQLTTVVDLLVVDETNPRSVAFQLVALARHVEQLPRQLSDPLLSEEQRLVIALLSSIQLADVNPLSVIDENGTRRQLEGMLDQSAKGLRNLARVVSHKYLVHAGPTHQMSDIRAH